MSSGVNVCSAELLFGPALEQSCCPWDRAVPGHPPELELGNNLCAWHGHFIPFDFGLLLLFVTRVVYDVSLVSYCVIL